MCETLSTVEAVKLPPMPPAIISPPIETVIFHKEISMLPPPLNTWVFEATPAKRPFNLFIPIHCYDFFLYEVYK